MNAITYIGVTAHLFMFLVFYPAVLLWVEREAGVMVLRTKVVDGVPTQAAVLRDDKFWPLFGSWAIFCFLYDLFWFVKFWLDQAATLHFGG